MREIKFRAWDRRNKTMQYVKYLRWLNNDKIASVGCGDEKGFQERLRPRDCVLMQYTGLKDKNGKEIYEGDLFYCIYKSDGHLDHIYSVEYLDSGAKFVLRRHGKKCPQNGVVQTVNDVARYEVIGNIYENPELLK